MSRFLEKIFRKLRPFNCFSHSNPESASIIPSHRRYSPITADNGSRTKGQESRSTTLDISGRAARDKVFQEPNEPSRDNRIIPSGAERQDCVRGDSQTIRPGENGYIRERGGNQQGLSVAQPRMTGRRPEEVNRHQQEAEERGPNEQPQLVFNGIFYQNFQKEDHEDGAMAMDDERSALLGTEITPTGSKQISHSAAVPATAELSRASSLDLSASPSPPWEEAFSSRAPADSGGAPTTSPLDSNDHPSPTLVTTSVPFDESIMTIQTDSPRRPKSAPLGLGLSLQENLTRWPHIESLVHPVRQNAHLRSPSLITASSMSTNSYSQLTIIHVESESAKTGEPAPFQALLDTGAERNAISENIVKRLGMRWETDTEGTTFKVIGKGAGAEAVIHPLGYISLTMRVITPRRDKPLRLKFYVLADSDVGRAFDCLLGKTDAARHFLAPKEDVKNRESVTSDL